MDDSILNTDDEFDTDHSLGNIVPPKHCFYDIYITRTVWLHDVSEKLEEEFHRCDDYYSQYCLALLETKTGNPRSIGLFDEWETLDEDIPNWLFDLAKKDNKGFGYFYPEIWPSRLNWIRYIVSMYLGYDVEIHVTHVVCQTKDAIPEWEYPKLPTGILLMNGKQEIEYKANREYNDYYHCQRFVLTKVPYRIKPVSADKFIKHRLYLVFTCEKRTHHQEVRNNNPRTDYDVVKD